MSLEYVQSFIKIGGVVFEKTRDEKRTDYFTGFIIRILKGGKANFFWVWTTILKLTFLSMDYNS